MSARSLAFLLLAGLPLGCATSAAQAPAPGDAVPAPRDAALSPQPVRVDGAEAKRLVAAGARLVDVRDAASYAGGHLPGAINVPVEDVAARAAEIGPAGASVVLYCKSGVRSAKAASILAGLGYLHVYDLGSYLNWGEGAGAPPPAAPLGPKT